MIDNLNESSSYEVSVSAFTKKGNSTAVTVQTTTKSVPQITGEFPLSSATSFGLIWQNRNLQLICTVVKYFGGVITLTAKDDLLSTF